MVPGSTKQVDAAVKSQRKGQSKGEGPESTNSVGDSECPPPSGASSSQQSALLDEASKLLQSIRLAALRGPMMSNQNQTRDGVSAKDVGGVVTSPVEAGVGAVQLAAPRIAG